MTSSKCRAHSCLQKYVTNWGEIGGGKIPLPSRRFAGIQERQLGRLAFRFRVPHKLCDCIHGFFRHQSISRELAPGNIPPAGLAHGNFMVPRNIGRIAMRIRDKRPQSGPGAYDVGRRSTSRPGTTHLQRQARTGHLPCRTADSPVGHRNLCLSCQGSRGSPHGIANRMRSPSAITTASGTGRRSRATTK